MNDIQINRKTAPYERALELAKLIILNYSPDINKGEQKMIALLFDMNQLWEEYVLHQLRKYAQNNPEQNWTITGQESKTFYGSYRTIRPDIVLKRNGETIIIDTKWKRPKNKAASIEDLRQMYAYARFWDTKKVMLLYPGEAYDSGYNSYPNPFDPEEKHQCKMGFISILDEKGALCDAIGHSVLGLVEIDSLAQTR
ncbi:5-methylcytosine restriction system specificity protein McrC [Mariniflexile sp. AS56]|uniref:5-methylcytosine restriction system specificity protein McrC n=1 Tax=Mariniflexile sp. AS56 TaxID=3063957 RepID=UPI0026F0A250|nr:hypothetical protein [Mariniflexile sp. AS56]MDO7173715.1 hypothetical protein [Mariniflexile sp. AS56]